MSYNWELGFRRMLPSDEVIDGLLTEVGREGVRLTGDGGFLPQLVKAAPKPSLSVEWTDHLGYDSGDAGRAGGAELAERVDAQDAGHRGRPGAGGGSVEVPRDGAGTFSRRWCSRRSAGSAAAWTT
jgi:putative transposase